MYSPEVLISFLTYVAVAVAFIWATGWALTRKFDKSSGE